MTELRRSLGLASLSFYGIGLILGAGVFSVIGAAAAEAGDGLWLSFLIGAAVALLTGLSYAELATALPRAGAEHVYLSAAFPRRPLIAYLAGAVLVLSGCATASTVALAFGGYLREMVPIPVLGAALALLVASSALNLVGIRESAWVNVAFTVVEASGLVLLIVLGMRSGRFGEALQADVGAGTLSGAALLFFAFLGFEEIVNLTEETRDPGRTIPRAILVSVAVTTVLYVLVGLAAVALVPAAEMAKSEAPLLAAAQAGSRRAAAALGVIALFATANTCLATLVGVSRMCHGMARAGALPGVFGRVLRTRKTPWAAALLVLGLAALMALPGDVPSIASLSSFGALVAFSGVNACLIILRFRQPLLERPFRVPLALAGVPVPAALGLVLALGLATQFDGRTIGAGIAATAVAALAWLTRRWWGSSGPSSTLPRPATR